MGVKRIAVAGDPEDGRLGELWGDGMNWDRARVEVERRLHKGEAEAFTVTELEVVRQATFRTQVVSDEPQLDPFCGSFTRRGDVDLECDRRVGHDGPHSDGLETWA